MKVGRFTIFVLVLAGGPLLSYLAIASCSYGVNLMCGHNVPASFVIGTVVGWVLLAALAVFLRSMRNTA